MKRCLLLAAIWFGITVLMPIGTVCAARVKIGMIDTKKIMRESTASKKARALFLKDLEGKRTVLKEKQVEILTMQNELKKEGKNMPPKEREEKASIIQREIKELGRLKSDLEEELKKKDRELTLKILREIREVVKEYLKKD